MTYQDLLNQLLKLKPEELDCPIAVADEADGCITMAFGLKIKMVENYPVIWFTDAKAKTDKPKVIHPL